MIMIMLSEDQGSPFPTARSPRASQITIRASGFEQIFLLYSIKHIEELRNSIERTSKNFEKRERGALRTW